MTSPNTGSASRPETLTEPDYDLYGLGPDPANPDPAGVFANLTQHEQAVRDRARAFALEKVVPIISVIGREDDRTQDQWLVDLIMVRF